MNKWLFDEFKHCGVDYSDADQVAGYDEEHRKFRNYEREIIDLLDALNLAAPEAMTLIDLGCGTGASAIIASKYFKRIYAVDVSEAMMDCAREKADMENIKNIEFINSGFLSYEHTRRAADIVLSKAALHHLPDFWKQIALLRMNKMLKPGGILYIFDIVFHFKPKDYEEKINNWIADFEKVAGAQFRKEVETHISEEYSTFNWVMQRMLEEAGFAIDKTVTPDELRTEYFCRKIAEKQSGL